jgi:tetrahydromethanopterin S-methyltransferase subunit H
MSPKRIPQKVSIGKLQIGRASKINPPVVIPSMFFQGHKILHDPLQGLFNHQAAELQLKLLEEIQEETGIPIIVDLVGESEQGLQKITEWALSTSDLPFSIDGGTPEIRLPVASWICEIGAQTRVAYNSISLENASVEIPFLSELKYPTCFVLLTGKSLVSAETRLPILREFLPLLEKSRIQQFLFDTVVLDRSSIGSAANACRLIKKQYGYPVGCAPGNSFTEWRFFDTPKRHRSLASIYMASIFLTVQNNADFLFIGPARITRWVARGLALATALEANELRWSQGTSIPTSHPLYRIFKIEKKE